MIGEINTSESTLRRDIDYLADTKQARKVRGGITRVERVANESRPIASPFSSERLKNADRKAAIGMKAAELLSGNEGTIVNGGTTTYNLASHLPKNGLTNSLSAVDYALRQTENRCFVAGDEMFHQHMIILGHLMGETPIFF